MKTAPVTCIHPVVILRLPCLPCKLISLLKVISVAAFAPSSSRYRVAAKHLEASSPKISLSFFEGFGIVHRDLSIGPELRNLELVVGLTEIKFLLTKEAMIAKNMIRIPILDFLKHNSKFVNDVV